MQKNCHRRFQRNPFSADQTLFPALAIIPVALFGIWWFSFEHIPHNFAGPLKVLDILLFVLVSYVVWHPIIMEVLTWCITSHIKDIPSKKPIPGLKVAFITTIVPKNEPVDLLHQCLPAMVKAKYPHDTWILDEGDSEEVKKICQQYGVKHFSRFGREEFNTQTGKYTKTKGGNHNSWYDSFGNGYDFVAQIDADFVPKSNFLLKTLGYFRDPKVAFVGTPQIYGNTKSSIALGAYEQQFSFYGAVLRGLSAMGMNLLIGANHVIRVSAFKLVGHYTAHITEDLVTGMKLHAAGWKSIYVPRPLAVGEGPSTWESYFNQQLRWAYGCIDILFHHSPHHFRKMKLRQTLYYLFLQQHYFSGLALAVSMVLLSLYFLFGIRAADVDIFKFFIFYSLVLLICWLMSVWIQRFDVEKGVGGQLLLPGKIISIAAWPIWFLALLSILTGKRLKYKVTPKGEFEQKRTVSPSVFIPHFIFASIAILGLLASFFTHRQSVVMEFWAISSALLMLTVPFAYDFMRGAKRIYYKLTSFGEKLLFKKNGLVNSESGYIALGLPSIEVSNTQEAFFDVLFLSFVVAVSCISYIGKLGFYSDDWSFLGNFTLSSDKSLLGLFQTATTPNTMMRPMQNFYDAFLYWLFGISPLGYHIVNSIVFICLILVFYLVLRRLRVPRIISVTAPLLYAFLPNYSTDRFWYAAYQVNLSMLLFLFSTYAGLRTFTAKNIHVFSWRALSIASLIFSTLSYEVTLPLVFLNMVLFWNPWEKLRAKKEKTDHLRNQSIFVLVNFIALLYLVVFKFKTTTRLGNLNYPGDVVHLVSSIVRVNFIELGMKFPLIITEILSRYSDPASLIMAGLLGLCVFLYLSFIFLSQKVELPKASFMGKITLIGVVVFFLGYAIFFTNNRVGFSPTGIDNRVSIAGSLGIALLILGGLGWISRVIMPQKLSKWLFCVLASLVCMSGFLVINTLADFWSSAYHKEEAVLSDIRMQFPDLPKNTTILLDGVCPYTGPGIVFESQWDLKGALQTMYGNSTIQADIITPRLKLKPKNIETQIYTFKADYPYKNLVIYNFKDKAIYQLPDKQSAELYFKSLRPKKGYWCPQSQAGNGVSVF